MENSSLEKQKQNRKKKREPKNNYKLCLVVLSILSFASSVTPLTICLIANMDKYVKNPGDAVSLGLGGIFAVLFILLKVLGKLKIPSRIVFYTIVFAMTFLLKSLLSDLVLLSGMALLGEFADYAIFQRAIKKTKERMSAENTATVAAEQVEKVIKKYTERI